MAMKLHDLVGIHAVEAYWEGEKSVYRHPVCGEECSHGLHCTQREDLANDSWSLAGLPVEDQRVLRNKFKRDRHRVILLRMDGITFMFQEEPVSSSIVADRSTICGNVEALATKDWPWVFQFDAAAGGPRVWSFQMFEDEELEILYAIDENTGQCCFEVGTQYEPQRNHLYGVHNEEYWFRWDFKPEGFKDTPSWLVPQEEGPPPVEIRGRKVTEYKGNRKGRKEKIATEQRRVEGQWRGRR